MNVPYDPKELLFPNRNLSFPTWPGGPLRAFPSLVPLLCVQALGLWSTALAPGLIEGQKGSASCQVPPSS